MRPPTCSSTLRRSRRRVETSTRPAARMSASPPGNWSLRLGRWRGVEIRVHVHLPLIALAVLLLATLPGLVRPEYRVPLAAAIDRLGGHCDRRAGGQRAAPRARARGHRAARGRPHESDRAGAHRRLVATATSVRSSGSSGDRPQRPAHLSRAPGGAQAADWRWPASTTSCRCSNPFAPQFMARRDVLHLHCRPDHRVDQRLPAAGQPVADPTVRRRRSAARTVVAAGRSRLGGGRGRGTSPTAPRR